MNTYTIMYAANELSVEAEDVDMALIHYGLTASECDWIKCNGVVVYS